MQRDDVTMVLLAEDLCRTCGQRFVYDDIEQLRANES